MSDDVVDQATAERDFATLIEKADGDLEDLNEKEQRDFDKMKRRLVRAICQGHLSIDEEGQPTLRQRFGKHKGSELLFRHPTGAVFIGSQKDDASAMYRMLGSVTETDAARFSQMDKRDLDVALAIGKIFLA